MTTGERIKHRREELSLTQAELAERMGYKSRAAISNVEKDKEDLTISRIRKFAVALECSPSYLMGWEDPEVKPMAQALLDAYSNQRQDAVLLELYHNASEKDQAMVRYILGYTEPDGEVPSLKNKKD